MASSDGSTECSSARGRQTAARLVDKGLDEGVAVGEVHEETIHDSPCIEVLVDIALVSGPLEADHD